MLREAGIERAMALVTCLSAATDNLFVCLSARDLNERLAIVARIRSWWGARWARRGFWTGPGCW